MNAEKMSHPRAPAAMAGNAEPLDASAMTRSGEEEFFALQLKIARRADELERGVIGEAQPDQARSAWILAEREILGPGSAAEISRLLERKADL